MRGKGQTYAASKMLGSVVVDSDERGLHEQQSAALEPGLLGSVVVDSELPGSHGFGIRRCCDVNETVNVHQYISAGPQPLQHMSFNINTNIGRTTQPVTRSQVVILLTISLHSY
jgi:hypothetical protein